jgi:hypothetical protein
LFRRFREFPREASVAVLVGALLLAPLHSASAQVKPSATWRTIETPHFRVTFTPELETIARRAGARAEEAYTELSAMFRAPRGRIDIVVADNHDIANGYATAYPSNRIVVYANPPIAAGALRFNDDYLETVVTHELLHVFQLDRAGGVWALGQKLFGRVPYLFPNVFQPSWALEGIAVRYETQLTGSGRLAGTDHRMLARAAELAHATPRLDQLSLASPRFPYAYTTYAWGSLFMDWLGETYGDSAMRRYVDASGRNLIPVLIDFPARRAFGKSMTRLYREWTQTLRDSALVDRAPMPRWRELTAHGGYAGSPRWLDDSTLLYTGTSGREAYALHRLRIREGSVERRRVARRHTESPHSVLDDGSIVYAQTEYADPYSLRSDLYLDRPRGGRVRLTRNARLSMPDAHGDGRIVAVQTVPGATRLALVSRDGRTIAPITSALEPSTSGDSVPVQWSEPRWSPDGTLIVAVRRGIRGVSELVVLDTLGGVTTTLFRARAVVSKPSWSHDGSVVYFGSDHEGIANLYRASVDSSAIVSRVSDAVTGLFDPEPAPGDSALAAVLYRFDGYHLGVAPLARDEGRGVRDERTDTTLTPEPSSLIPDAVPTIAGASRAYSAWRSLLPRYWVPLVGSALTEDSWRIGAYTAGEDLVGRHAYRALAYVPTDASGITGSLYYRNASFTQPLIELGASQDWENRATIFDDDDGAALGTLRRRVRDGYASFTLQRPRARTYSYASFGGGVEQRIYSTSPEVLLQTIPAAFRGLYHYPRVFFSAGWSNTQMPALAISPEDGISIGATTRYRWRTNDTILGTHSLIAAASGFKSLDLPGFAHHVAALRIAAGEIDDRATSYLEVGGVSGGYLEVLPGHALGEGSRTFQVRGFPAGSLLGMRAVTTNLEYRAPLMLSGRGLGSLPLFLDRTSLTLFGDAGTAWCPGLYPTRTFPDTSICTVDAYAYGRTTAPEALPFIHLDRQVIASAGAELNINAAILSRDAPFLYRLGVAVPVAGKELVASVQPVSWYFTVGVSF